MDTEEKIYYIEQAIEFALKHSEFGSADLSLIKRQAYRHRIDEDDVQQYIATQVATGRFKTCVVGRSYYITPSNS